MSAEPGGGGGGPSTLMTRLSSFFFCILARSLACSSRAISSSICLACTGQHSFNQPKNKSTVYMKRCNSSLKSSFLMVVRQTCAYASCEAPLRTVLIRDIYRLPTTPFFLVLRKDCPQRDSHVALHLIEWGRGRACTLVFLQPCCPASTPL